MSDKYTITLSIKAIRKITRKENLSDHSPILTHRKVMKRNMRIILSRSEYELRVKSINSITHQSHEKRKTKEKTHYVMLLYTNALRNVVKKNQI